MGFFYFLGQKKFYKHFLIVVLLSFFLLWATLWSLDIFTRHGKVFLVPDFYGLTIDDLEAQLYYEYFDLEIIDSIYDKKATKGSVIMQNPLPGSKVKGGRHIYLTIVAASPGNVLMPNLKNLSLRQALVTAESLELIVGKLVYTAYFARNAVVDQLIDGETVEAGTELMKGTSIDLLVGIGEPLIKVPFPLLIALRNDEVRKVLHYSSLNVGNEFFLDTEDLEHARVYKTNPRPLSKNLLEPGQTVDVWYRSDEDFDFESYLLKFRSDTLTMDTIQQPLNIKVSDEF